MRRPSLNTPRAHGVGGVGGVGGESTVRQWVNVAAVLTGSVIARLEGGAWAAPLAVSAASVLLILTILLALFEQDKRDCALELILAGDEATAIAAVQRQRRRLLSARTASACRRRRCSRRSGS